MEKNTCILPTKFLLPKNIDVNTWAVIACDQFTSEKEYWENVKNIIGNKNSTLNLILPECYLSSSNEKDIEEINNTMNEYLSNGVFTETQPGIILLKRKFSSGKIHYAFVLSVDLEYYDYTKGSTSLIRATEKTVEERIPPRLKIRKDAPIELTHTMILYDDKNNIVLTSAKESISENDKIYSGELNSNGGYIEGYFIPDYQKIISSFNEVFNKNNYSFSLAVGDGNHSLATAKAHWENIKKTLSQDEQKNHPARYFLAELTNIYDDGIYFNPIYRFVKNPSEEFLTKLNELPYEFSIVNNDKITNHNGISNLISLINELDELIKSYNLEVDYIHGTKNLINLVKSNSNSIGILLDTFDKSKLFDYVEHNGTLPKKTFSIGVGIEKRYYLECKKIK